MIARSAGLLLAGVAMLGAGPGLAAQRAQVAPIDFSRDLGLVAADSQGKFCLSTTNTKLKPGREITLIWVPVEGEPFKAQIRRAKIAAKLVAPCDDSNQLAGDASYRLEADRLHDKRIYLSIVPRPGGLRLAGNEVKARSGKNEISFRSCTSTEGLHFSVWSGSQAKEQELWRRYFYLGYDIEPTCAERDF